APDLLRFQPDMVLIYTGHNEFYGPDGIGASWIEKQIPSLTSLKYSTRNLRLMSFTRNFLRSAFRQNTPAPDFNLMRQVSRENQVDQSSDDAARVLKNFARNLQIIIQTFSGKGIPVIISDVTSNLLFPPFASLSQGDTAGIGTAVLLARQAASAADAQQIAHRLAPLLRSNPFHADLLYCRGMLELMQGNETAASGFLQSARDRDALAFRAPASINQVIHATARRTGIPCLPADSLFTAALPDLPSYSGLFWEHLHPTPKGYYDLAGRFLDEILNSGRLGIVSSLRPLPFDNDSLSLCWLDLAFGDISISNLTSKWPFRDYHVTPLVLNSEDEQLRAAVQEVYEQKAVWDAGCYKTAALFARQGRLREAQTTYDAVLEEYPYNFYAHYLLGSLLNQKGEHAAAFSHYAQSVSSNPRYPFALLDFGLLKVNMGRFDEAIGHFNSALAVIPSSEEPALRANIYYGLAAASANKKDFQTALADIDQALALKPTYNDALALRAQIQSFRQR
ncbi:MAG: tetratricopeptide repeat protein, partial [Ignavibacteriales bacterium]|nr:tetratricopeptide repeat protein [Ignavibacteriales bacterium]